MGNEISGNRRPYLMTCESSLTFVMIILTNTLLLLTTLITRLLDEECLFCFPRNYYVSCIFMSLYKSNTSPCMFLLYKLAKKGKKSGFFMHAECGR